MKLEDIKKLAGINAFSVLLYSVSFCLIVFTFGMIFIFYASADINIEIANMKIGLNNALSKTEKILDNVKKESEGLKEDKDNLIDQLDYISDRLNKINSKSGKEELYKEVVAFRTEWYNDKFKGAVAIPESTDKIDDFNYDNSDTDKYEVQQRAIDNIRDELGYIGVNTKK